MIAPGQLACPTCASLLTIPAVGDIMHCDCGAFRVRRPSADSYIVRAPCGKMGRALEAAMWVETPGPTGML